MRAVGMVPGRPEPVLPPRYHLLGSGNLDVPIRAGVSGYFVSDVELLESVAAGQPLGRILDFAGDTLETIRADRDGCVVMTRGLPVIHAGEGAFVLTGLAATTHDSPTHHSPDPERRSNER
jgi:predicted deacylase